MKNILFFDEITKDDVPRVGGKNASLGEMTSRLGQLGITVPTGFATTALAYQTFLQQNNTAEKIYSILAKIDIQNSASLTEIAASIRRSILQLDFPRQMRDDIAAAYQRLGDKMHGDNISVAVRSSATAEDLADASFAGQQETFLNVQGIEHVLEAIKRVYASLFLPRSISYRTLQGFSHDKVAISAGVQRMVRSDIGASGVLFTLDTESGFDQVVLINAAYGLGETIVQGSVDPDEFYLYKPNILQNKPAVIRRNLGSKTNKMVYTEQQEIGASTAIVPVSIEAQQRYCLNDAELEQLAKQALTIEQHYGRPMDIEWAKDGVDGKIYITQARPETVVGHTQHNVLKQYHLREQGAVIVTGRSIGQRIGHGKARVILNPKEMGQLKSGEVLVTDMTDPDWEPVMKRSAAIVTNRGGRTCHAAIIARELGIPSVIGCGDATTVIKTGDEITVSCAEGDTGHVFQGLLKYDIDSIEIDELPEIPVHISLILADPDIAFTQQYLPNHGVGLARLEFIISNMIGVHPNAVLAIDKLKPGLRAAVLEKTAAYASPTEYYIEKLKEGIATIGAAFYPKQVIVRFSDFKSNEYANLLGGHEYEPVEENPMLGFRGTARYIAPQFKACFELECKAIKRVREELGLTNVHVMAPFVRTLTEAKALIQLLAEFDLPRGGHGLKVYMMCEVPSNAILAEEFLEIFDGFSIGSNDLTQLTLGIDRDSSLIAGSFDERDPAVKALLSRAISTCLKANKYVGICGQGPSDHPDLASWLVEQGITHMALNADSVLDTWLYLGQAGKK